MNTDYRPGDRVEVSWGDDHRTGTIVGRAHRAHGDNLWFVRGITPMMDDLVHVDQLTPLDQWLEDRERIRERRYEVENGGL